MPNLSVSVSVSLFSLQVPSPCSPPPWFQPAGAIFFPWQASITYIHTGPLPHSSCWMLSSSSPSACSGGPLSREGSSHMTGAPVPAAATGGHLGLVAVGAGSPASPRGWDSRRDGSRLTASPSAVHRQRSKHIQGLSAKKAYLHVLQPEEQACSQGAEPRRHLLCLLLLPCSS